MTHQTVYAASRPERTVELDTFEVLLNGTSAKQMLNNSDLCVALTAAENSIVNCIQISSCTVKYVLTRYGRHTTDVLHSSGTSVNQ